MVAIQVERLKLHCPTERRDHMRFLIEDGLRTSIPDDRRLVLVRRMLVRGDVSCQDPARREDAMRTGWLAAIGNARHGAEDGAADANCVWFVSREEAETLLLARLLAGRGTNAWYWRLAVPSWCGRSVGNWVFESVAEAMAIGQGQRLLAIARCFIAASAVDQLVEIVRGLAENCSAAGPALPAADPRQIQALSKQLPAAEVADKFARAFAQSIARELGTFIEKLLRSGIGARAVVWAIVRAWLLKRSPALTLSPVLVNATVEATVNALIVQQPMLAAATRADPLQRGWQRLVAESSDQRPEPTFDSPPVIEAGRGTASVGEAAANALAPQCEPATSGAKKKVSEVVPKRMHSAHAGLWLVVPSLVELGFRDWLAERPMLLGNDPGAQLLREIACRYRLPPDDAALIPILSDADPDVRLEWCRLWRQGLDNWLRRTVRRRLHDLVGRPGELDLGDQSLVIHYPADAADLALRRYALDRDPGWTDWLGLSIRYNFGGIEDWL